MLLYIYFYIYIYIYIYIKTTPFSNRTFYCLEFRTSLDQIINLSQIKQRLTAANGFGPCQIDFDSTLAQWRWRGNHISI